MNTLKAEKRDMETKAKKLRREALVEIKESNNKYQRERNEKKELELAEREKVVESNESNESNEQ